MISRIGIGLFYAVIFFLLGAWYDRHGPSVGDAVHRGYVSASFAVRERLGMTTAAETRPDAQAAAGQASAESAASASAPAPAPEAAAAASAAAPAPAAAPAAFDLVREARAAYAAGDVEKAVELYRKRIAAKADDVDARGELGNVFVGSGRLHEAALAYFEAAEALLAKGDTEGARALLPIVQRNDATLGAALAKRLM